MSSAAREMASKYLGDVKDPKLKKELAEAMADFEKEFGIDPKTTVQFKDLGADTFGQAGSATKRITINSRFLDGRMSTKDAAHTMAHELTHTLDKTEVSGSNAEFKGTKVVLKSANKKFDKQLTAAYKTFKQRYGSEQTKKIGSYALTNKHEFFAEALASHMTGTKTVYGDFAYKLAKSMTK